MNMINYKKKGLGYFKIGVNNTYFKDNSPFKPTNGYYRYYLSKSNKGGWNGGDYLGRINMKEHKIIQASEILKQYMKKYTIEELKSSPKWIKCTNITEGKTIGRLVPKGSWEHFNFDGHSRFYVTADGRFTGYLDYVERIGGEIIEFSQVIFPEEKVVGYKLIKEYPGVGHKLGYIEPYTSGLYSNYPEFWEAQYSPKEEFLQISCGNGGFEVQMKANKKVLYIEEMSVSIVDIQNLLSSTQGKKYTWEYSATHFDIGCKKGVKREDLQKIVDTYNKLNS